MKERLTIVFIALIVGLAITTIGFFIYESTKIVPKDTSPKPPVKKNMAVAEKKNPVTLSIDEPRDESISDKRTIQVKGKTDPENIIVVSTNQEDVVATPTSQGQFAVTIVIDAGTNKIVTRAINPSGNENVDERIITFSTEDF